MPADVRRPLYQGSQLVAALWFDCALLGEDAARARVLAQWEPGARAYHVHDGYLLEWATPRRLHCAHAPGLALCAQQGVLSSAPLRDGERASIAAGGAVLVLGAAAHPVELGPATRIDPARWLDLSSIAWAKPLAMPRGRDAGFVNSVEPPAADVRALLGDAVPPPSAAREEFLRRAERPTRQARFGGTGVKVLAAAMIGASLLSGALGALFAVLPLGGRGRRAGGTASDTGTSAQAPMQAGKQGGGWRAMLAQLAMFTRLSQVLGWRQSRYLRDMLRQFDEGDLDEALRRAIPLDSARPADRPALGTPGRRDSLAIGERSGSAVGIGLMGEDLALLRQTYERAFEKLDREGRIDEAVFVLAELLNRHTEAVDYLERKGRLEQAARLAETLALPPALIVRLHCMAGDPRRALALARLTHAFGDALAELERRQHPAAPGLRVEWAEDLAARGEVVQAASVIWPLQEERQRASHWLREAEQAGGVLGVQGLLYQLALDPPSASGAAVETLLYAAGDEESQARALACACILKMDGAAANPTIRRVAAQLWRALLADHAAGFAQAPAEQVARLLTLADDRLLAADAPKGKPPVRDPRPLAERKQPLTVRVDERGLLPIEDACMLPDGTMLVALGEQGVALLRRDGSVQTRFPLPAHHLVLAQGGQAALALARREKSVRVSRIDLARRKMSDWFSAPLAFWANDYDGAGWSVVADDRLMVLDTAAAGQSVLWQVSERRMKIAGFARHEHMEALLLDHALGVEQWRYVLPGRRLVGRQDCPDPGPDIGWLADPSGSDAATVAVSEATAGGFSVHLRHGAAPAGLRIALPTAITAPQLRLHGRLFTLTFDSADGWHCQLHDPAGALLADIALPGARQAQAALRAGHLCAWDQCGRLAAIDLASGTPRTFALS